MRSSLKIIATLVFLLCSNVYAAQGRNCWDPSTWGPQEGGGSGMTELSEMPVAFLNDAHVREQLVRLMSSQTHVEYQAITVHRSESKDHTLFIFASTKEFMPPAKRSVSHFTISIPENAEGAIDWVVSDIVHGAYLGS